MDYFLQQMINALARGSVLALLSAGYTITFGVVGLVNFAHGEVFMLAAFAAYFAVSVYGLSFGYGVLAAIVGAIIIGLIIERIAFKPLRGAGMIPLFITSLAVSIALRNIIIMFYGDVSRRFVYPDFLKGVHFVGDLIIFRKNIVIFVLTIIIGALVVLFINNTKTGIAMRAISYDLSTASALGINSEKLIIIAFALSSTLAGIGALFYGIRFGSLTPTMGVVPVIECFVASVLGGIGNVMGAIVAGFIIGVGQVLFIAFLPEHLTGLRPLFVWIVFFIILIFKPSGIFRSNIQ